MFPFLEAVTVTSFFLSFQRYSLSVLSNRMVVKAEMYYNQLASMIATSHMWHQVLEVWGGVTEELNVYIEF